MSCLKHLSILRIGFCSIICLFNLVMVSADEKNTSNQELSSGNHFQVGVARVDITPKEEITLAGSPSPKKTSRVDTPLYVKAMVVSSGNQKAAIVTLDTLKYPINLVVQAHEKIEKRTQIPSKNVIISASHTHFGPLYSYYPDRLVDSIVLAVRKANEDMTPCKIGTATGKVIGFNRNRRIVRDGQSWNTWLVNSSVRENNPAEGPADPELSLLAVMNREGKYKAILYNYACHPVSTRGAMISADYPGHVQKYVEEQLGYEVPTLFLLGSCGDVNSTNSNAAIGQAIGKEMTNSFSKLEWIESPSLSVVRSVKNLPGREAVKFDEKDITLKWNAQLEHYRKAFNKKKQERKSSYKSFLNGIRFGEDFAIVTNPVELFCEIGMNIKRDSPFSKTMVATLTNGASGYVPTERSFQLGGYETWYGEHSFLAIRTGKMIQEESLGILKQLETKK